MSTDKKQVAPKKAAATDVKKAAKSPESKRDACIHRFEAQALIAQIYSIVCCLLTVLFIVLHNARLVPLPVLDKGDSFAEPGSIEFTLLVFFAGLHAAAAVLLHRRVTAQRAAVGLAIGMCASLVYILLFFAIHLSHFLEVQFGDDGAQAPSGPEEGSGLAMAEDYFGSLKAQEDAAKAAMMGQPQEAEAGWGMLAIGELILMVISTVSSIFTSLLDPKNRAKISQDPDAPHTPMFYLARIEMCALSVIGLVLNVVAVFQVETYSEAVQAQQARPVKAAKPARESALTAEALGRHVRAQDPTAADAETKPAPSGPDATVSDNKKRQ